MGDEEWVVPENRRRLTPNRYHAGYKPELIKPVEALVYHFTVSSRSAGTVRWLCNPDAGVSADFVIGRGGDVWQLAPLSDRTWHAGGATSKFNGLGNVNGRSKGIEIVNWGPLFLDDKKYRTVGRNSVTVDQVDVWASERSGGVDDEKTTYRYWERFTMKQIRSLQWLTQVLTRRYPEAELVGHEDVDPTRKVDPGPAFPWDEVLKAVDHSKDYPAP